MSRLVLVRHARVTQDPGIPVEKWSLSPEGVTAATALRGHPALKEVDVFYSSPEPKALATAAIIAGGCLVVPVSDLRELDRRAAGWVGDEADHAAMVEDILLRPGERIRGCEPADFLPAELTGASGTPQLP